MITGVSSINARPNIAWQSRIKTRLLILKRTALSARCTGMLSLFVSANNLIKLALNFGHMLRKVVLRYGWRRTTNSCVDCC
jgi:hypothetical protein